MKNATKKIGFFFLSFKTNEPGISISTELSKVLNYCISLSKVKRKLDLSDDKFCIIESCEYDRANAIHKIVFKSATHSYRANLIDKKTVEERENPKKIDEGEGKKTHLVIKYKNGDAIVLLETSQKGLNMKQIVRYMNSYVRHYNASHKRDKLTYQFDFSIIPRDDFREVLDSMSRVLCASIYVDKQILGTAALGFSDRLNSVQEDIIIEVKTERQGSIKAFAFDAMTHLAGVKKTVRKIRIKGKNAANNDVTIDTEFIVKKEYVETLMNEETGEIFTPNMLSEMVELAKTF